MPNFLYYLYAFKGDRLLTRKTTIKGELGPLKRDLQEKGWRVFHRRLLPTSSSAATQPTRRSQ